jgi:hypothetical protein
MWMEGGDQRGKNWTREQGRRRLDKLIRKKGYSRYFFDVETEFVMRMELTLFQPVHDRMCGVSSTIDFSQYFDWATAQKTPIVSQPRVPANQVPTTGKI